MDSRRILRVSIPVDDQWHTVTGCGTVLHVATRHVDQVEMWFLSDPAAESRPREFSVVGTGHDLRYEYVGTAIAPGGALVWHLIERIDYEAMYSQPAIEGSDGR